MAGSFLVAGGLILPALAVRVESRAGEPIIPLTIFRNRTVSLTVTASVLVGIAMFGGTVFVSQYFRLLSVNRPRWRNDVPAAELGAATSMLTFFRSMGGAIGVSALGGVPANRVADLSARSSARRRRPRVVRPSRCPT